MRVLSWFCGSPQASHRPLALRSQLVPFLLPGSGGRALNARQRKHPGELREIRIDLARASDELTNFTKFFGDFHIARIYETVAKRFHLSDWHRTVDDKLKTLDNLYQMLATDRNTRWMFILEIAIVLLFIIDVGILLKTMH